MKYIHKKTKVEVTLIESNSESHQYVGASVNFPRWAVENSDDWEEISDNKEYSVMDIKNAYNFLQIKFGGSKPYLSDLLKQLKQK